jgi:hypothetical protein
MPVAEAEVPCNRKPAEEMWRWGLILPDFCGLVPGAIERRSALRLVQPIGLVLKQRSEEHSEADWQVLAPDRRFDC